MDDRFTSILWGCLSPAFIWSVGNDHPLAMNPQGESFLRSFMAGNDNASPNLRKIIPDLGEFPDTPCFSVWMDYTHPDGKTASIQTRCSSLDPEGTLWLCVICTGDAFSHISAISPAFFDQLEDLWQKVTPCDEYFSEAFRRLETFTAEGLCCTDFGFFPSDYWKESGLLEGFRACLNDRSLEPILSSALDFPGASGNSLITRGEIDYFPVFDDEHYAGFLFMEGLRESLRDTALSVCRLLATKILTLSKNMELRKENFQNALSKRLNEIIFKFSKEAVFVTDSSYNICFMNAQAGEMLGFGADEVLGHPIPALLDPGEEMPEFSALSEGCSVRFIHRRSGESFPCDMHAAAMDKDYLVFIIQDRSEFEANRMKSEQLSQRAFLGDFASMLAHEVRNPVNNIRMSAENLRAQAGDNEKINKGIDRIFEDCERISDLVTNILNFSRPMSLAMESLDLRELISQLIEKWRVTFARRGIACYFHAPETFPKCPGDPRRLEQVLNNLIQNSVDALGTSGGVITLRLAIEESEDGKQMAVISESDNGSGIPSELLEKIFEPFVTSKKNGNGWGLALCKRIITKHGGRISVKSFGGGTLFEISLPLSKGRV